VKSGCIRGKFQHNFQIVIVLHSKTIHVDVNKLRKAKQLLAAPEKNENSESSQKRNWINSLGLNILLRNHLDAMHKNWVSCLRFEVSSFLHFCMDMNCYGGARNVFVTAWSISGFSCDLGGL
jgi:hypothetical protein